MTNPVSEQVEAIKAVLHRHYAPSGGLLYEGELFNTVAREILAAASSLPSPPPVSEEQIALVINNEMGCGFYGPDPSDKALVRKDDVQAAARAVLKLIAAQPPVSGDAIKAFLLDVVRAVGELPDRTSPDDAPEMMLVSSNELTIILANYLAAHGIIAAQPAPDIWQPWPAPKTGEWVIALCHDRATMFRVSWGRDRAGELAWCGVNQSYGYGLFTAWRPFDAAAQPAAGDRIAEDLGEILSLRNKNEELEAGFDLRWKADRRAIKRWQAATGKKLTWPDQADLCAWLLDQLDAAQPATTVTTELEMDRAIQAFWDAWPAFREWWSSDDDSYGKKFTVRDIPPEPFEAALAELTKSPAQPAAGVGMGSSYRSFELGALSMQLLAVAKCLNETESLQEGLMTDAGLSRADKTAMNHQITAIEIVQESIRKETPKDAHHYGSYMLPKSEQTELKALAAPQPPSGEMARTIPPLTEGPRKGGRNTPPSQIKERPGAPGAMTPKPPAKGEQATLQAAEDVAKLIERFTRQTVVPLSGRTEPTVSWFGTPNDAAIIINALRALSASRDTAGLVKWYVGIMNDAAFIINKPPRKVPTDYHHDIPGVTVIAALGTQYDLANEIVAAHNAALASHAKEEGKSNAS